MKHSLVGACFYYTTKIRYDKTDKLHYPQIDNIVILSCHIVFSLYNKKQAPARLSFFSPASPAYIFLQYHINVLAE